MIYRYIDKEKSGLSGGISVSKLPKSEHYIVREINSKKPCPLEFLKLLNLLVIEGYSLSESIDIILDSNERFINAKIIKLIRTDLNRGIPFYKSLSRHFNLSNYEFTLLKMAEKEGNLKEILGDVILNITEKKNIKNKTKRALYYPFLLILLGSLLMIFISKFVAPVFLNVLNGFGGELPFISKVAFAITNFLSASGVSLFLVLISLIILCFFIIIKFPKLEIKLRKYIYKNRFLGLIYRAKFQYMFFKEFGVLYKYSGNYEEVMQFLIDESRDIFIKLTLSGALKKVKYGLKIEDVKELYDLFSNFSMSIFSKLNREDVVSDVSKNLSNLHKSRYDDYLDSLLKMIGPIMVLLIGGVVAIVALGIMLPIFNLGNNL